MLGDLGAGDEDTAPVLPHQQTVADEVVDHRAQGGAGDPEFLAQLPLAREGTSGAGLLDQVEEVGADAFPLLPTALTADHAYQLPYQWSFFFRKACLTVPKWCPNMCPLVNKW